MMAFRETFARPVKPIRFLGLFDTVNSVPRFENALMARTKFPYTARSSARVIRHAVSIGERRAKFRQDLIGEAKTNQARYRQAKRKEMLREKAERAARQANGEKDVEKDIEKDDVPLEDNRGRRATLQVPHEQFRDHAETSGVRSRSPNYSIHSDMQGSELESHLGFVVDEEEEGQQDIQEVWFSGCHAVSHSKTVKRFANDSGYWWRLAFRTRRRSRFITYPTGLDGTGSSKSWTSL
jgi:hypothetical protein